MSSLEHFHTVVVACDPRALRGLLEFTDAEASIVNQLYDSVFCTHLLEVPNDKHGPGIYADICVPSVIESNEGRLHAYRNELRRLMSNEQSARYSKAYIVTYQIWEPRPSSEIKEPPTSEQFTQWLTEDIERSSWFPWKQFQIINRFRSHYFLRFRPHALRTAPWEILRFNGNNHTIYVHAFTAFESILHIFHYIETLFQREQVRQSLPRNKSTPIAIIGAGPSGLLAARKLRLMGYENLTILEKDARYGGKTLTVPITLPEDGHQIYCEMGTCYLSPAYKPLIEALGIKEQVFNLGGSYYDRTFRGIFDGQAVVPFLDYMVGKEGVLHVVSSAMRYRVKHHEFMGSERPFPSKPPDMALMRQTFLEFLRAHELDGVIPLITYAFELQGYGILSNIPAFYGLEWIAPEILETVLIDGVLAKLHMRQVTLIGIVDKGWISVWDKIVKEFNLKIRLNTTIHQIRRSSTGVMIRSSSLPMKAIPSNTSTPTDHDDVLDIRKLSLKE